MPTTLTRNEELVSPLFDRACELRDQKDYQEALELLKMVVNRLTMNDKRLLVHAHLQLGHIHDLLGDDVQEEEHFRIAVNLAPRLELASLALFHALRDLGRHEGALREMLRLVSVRDSNRYREALDEGFRHRLSPAEHDIIGKVRELFARYRQGRNV
jgi:tetratricopeptide (TPR) repeat protein